MTHLLRTEARKLTTRSTVVLAGVTVVYPALVVLAAALSPGHVTVDRGTVGSIVRGTADVAILAATLLGILAAAGEHRHGTIVPSLLVEPDRRRFLLAKLTSQAGMGVVLMTAAASVAMAAGGAYVHGRAGTAWSDMFVTSAAAVAVVGLYGVIGAGVGAVVRNQTAAVAGALVWLFAVENAIPIVFHDLGLRRWLPGGAAERLLHLADPAPDMGPAWAAALLLTGVAALVAAIAVVVTDRVDIH